MADMLRGSSASCLCYLSSALQASRTQLSWALGGSSTVAIGLETHVQNMQGCEGQF